MGVRRMGRGKSAVRVEANFRAQLHTEELAAQRPGRPAQTFAPVAGVVVGLFHPPRNVSEKNDGPVRTFRRMKSRAMRRRGGEGQHGAGAGSKDYFVRVKLRAFIDVEVTLGNHTGRAAVNGDVIEKDRELEEEVGAVATDAHLVAVPIHGSLVRFRNENLVRINLRVLSDDFEHTFKDAGMI